MKLIFALGNPESTYGGTRHNIGFDIVDQLAEQHDITWKKATRFQAETAELRIGQEKVVLAKPTTYYNNVGQSWRSLVDYFGLSSGDTLIVHDDLGLDFGVIRTRLGGSGGGSNGIRSINAHGGDMTARLRIGIRNDLADSIDGAKFVLGKFSKAESEVLPAIIDRSAELVRQFALDQLSYTTDRLSDS